MAESAYNEAQTGRDEDEATELKFPEAFKNAVPLTISEVNLLLEHRSQLMARNNLTVDDDKLLGPVLPNAREFCARFGKLKNDAANERVRNLLESRKVGCSLDKFEVVSLANLCPKTVEEAEDLIPSLEGRFEDEDIQQLVDDVQTTVAFSQASQI